MLLLYWLGLNLSIVWLTSWDGVAHPIVPSFLILYSCNQVVLESSVENPMICVISLSGYAFGAFRSSSDVTNALCSSPGCHVYSVFSPLHWFLSDLLSDYSQARLQAANRRRDLCRLNAQDPLTNYFPVHVNLRLLIHTDDKCGPIQMHGYRTKS